MTTAPTLVLISDVSKKGILQFRRVLMRYTLHTDTADTASNAKRKRLSDNSDKRFSFPRGFSLLIAMQEPELGLADCGLCFDCFDEPQEMHSA